MISYNYIGVIWGGGLEGISPFKKCILTDDRALPHESVSNKYV